jgi:hypothetical protein
MHVQYICVEAHASSPEVTVPTEEDTGSGRASNRGFI